RAHAAEGRWAAAIAHYEETLRLSPHSALFHAEIGQIHERSGGRRAALGRYVEALRRAPGLAQACRGIERVRGDTPPPPESAACPR
ncbi:MAG: tetratricopeptide repeat protein, partial [Candidatus Rokuibacteriota bacterium]